MFIYPKTPKLWISQLGKLLISSYHVQSYNLWQNILNSILHFSIESHLTNVSWVLVVINQTNNLTFNFPFSIIYISKFQMEILTALLISTIWKNFNSIFLIIFLTRFIISILSQIFETFGHSLWVHPTYASLYSYKMFNFKVYSQLICIFFAMKYFFNL
jgi:hypothetical protein